MTERLIKIGLSIFLFLCLLDMPYGYYQLVRFLAFAGFAYLSFINFSAKNERLAFAYAMLAVLFQPIIKIPLGREIWNFVDVVVGVGLLITLFIKPKKS